MSASIRLQVFLSHSGVCSRRKAMDLVQHGHVTVNGSVQKEPSTKVTPGVDIVTVDGKPIESKGFTYILLNKPRDYVCTKAEFAGEKSVLVLLPSQYRHLVPVGRLDKDTEGLLLFTNDGDLAYRLTHPKFNIDKTYFVCVYGILQADERRKLERGVEIKEGGTFVGPIIEEYLSDEDEPQKEAPRAAPDASDIGKVFKTAPAKITEIKPYTDRTRTEFLLTLHEGKKRQIRLMCEAIGHKVAYLKRVAQGPLSLGDLPLGKFKELSPYEANKLKTTLTQQHSPRPSRDERTPHSVAGESPRSPQRSRHPSRPQISDRKKRPFNKNNLGNHDERH